MATTWCSPWCSNFCSIIKVNIIISMLVFLKIGSRLTLILYPHDVSTTHYLYIEIEDVRAQKVTPKYVDCPLVMGCSIGHKALVLPKKQTNCQVDWQLSCLFIGQNSTLKQYSIYIFIAEFVSSVFWLHVCIVGRSRVVVSVFIYIKCCLSFLHSGIDYINCSKL